MPSNPSKRSPGLKLAAEKLRTMRESGEQPRRLDPLEKHDAQPKSLRKAITAKCYDCVGRDCDPNWRARVGECSVSKCPLHSVRPYQSASGDTDDEGETG